ncbi:MAG TPA: ABC transporter substrate-binding protein [Janthinobacterium sp.]|nr:ABC transporter substrate-binding protein [Janthinobacterium sp.]
MKIGPRFEFPRRPGALRRGVGALSLALPMILAAGPTFAAGPDCSRPFTLALHDHGLLYSADTDSGIDKDIADELIRRSGCKVGVSLMSRARIWQLIKSGALDFSLSGIANPERDSYAGFAWYFSNKYYLLARKDAGARDLDDVRGNASFRLGVIRSFRYSPAANELVDQLQSANRVNQANGLAPLYQALHQNHIQGMIMEPFDYPAVDEKHIRDICSVIEFNDAPVPHGLIMSKQALAPPQRARWRALIDAMRADGTVRRIFEKYFDAKLAASMVDFRAAP